MSGLLTVEGLNLKEQIARATAVQKRLLDMRPPLESSAERMDRLTANAWDKGQDQAGNAFPPLAESTVEGRIALDRGANRRSKKTGALTRGARAKREAIRGIGGAEPLLATRNARRTYGTRVTGPHEMTFRIAGYMVPSMAGGAGGKPPQRNPTCLLHIGPNTWDLTPNMRAYHMAAIRAWVIDGANAPSGTF